MLHLAMKHNASLVMIQCFVASYPQAVRVADKQGNLPIHYAFCEGARTLNLAKKLETLLRGERERDVLAALVVMSSM